MIKTESKQYYSGESQIYTFNVPTFSVIKKVYLADNYIYMIIDFPEEYKFDSTKLINLKISQYTTPVDDYLYKYFDTQIINRSELVNSSYSSNIQFSIIMITETYHFFINEMKPLIEERDNKIDNIIKND